MAKKLLGKPDNSKQQELIAQQQADLKQQREEADREASRLRDQRVSQEKSRRGRLGGRRSLISTSELGVTDQLG